MRSTRALPASLSIACLTGIALAAPRAASRPANAGPQPDRSEVYRTVEGTAFKLHIFLPKPARASEKRAAIVFFFGGGWKTGSASQFFPQCRYLADRGMVAMSADYRVSDRNHSTIADAVIDAQSAIRWVRAHAEGLGIDPNRIAAAGGSAGGHLAAATALLDDFTNERKSKIDCRPNALVLFNPAVDLTPDRTSGKSRLRIEERMGAPAIQLSPADHIRKGLPPTIIFHGKADSLIPYSTIETFTKALRDAGNNCKLIPYAGQGHGFFNKEPYYTQTMEATEEFLASIGYLPKQKKS